MININIPAFKGMAPRVSPALLEETQGVSVTGTVTSGELRPWRRPRFVVDCLEDTQSIYLTPQGDWLTWDEVVNVHPAVQASDAFGRLYYTRESGGLFVVSPLDGYEEFMVGVPRPEVAPTVVVSGSGSGDIQDRVYVYTYVNGFGEESAPSPPSDFYEWQPGKTVTLSDFAAPPLGYKVITAIRIYRVAVGVTDADWFFVAEIDPNATSYVDGISDLDLGEVLSTAQYDVPPVGVRGLLPIGSGMFAAFKGNEILFSEPYLSYAWPDAYRTTVSGSVVALGVVADSLIVLTTSTPYRILILHPSSSLLSPDQFPQIREPEVSPCISPRSVVSTEFGVIFSAPDGLRVMGNSGSSKLMTEALLTAQEWVAMFDPLHIRAAYHDGTYFGWSGTGGFAFHARTGVLSWTGMDAVATHSDGLSLYISNAERILEWEGEVGLMEAVFRSKIFRFPKPVNLAALRIDSSISGAMILIATLFEQIQEENLGLEREVLDLADEEILGQSVAGDNLLDLPWGDENLGTHLVTVWADGILRFAQVVGGAGFARLPAGFLAREWQFEVRTYSHIKQVVLGSSSRALTGGQ